MIEDILSAGLVPVEEAATALGIDVERLRGHIARNGIPDPIGDDRFVYGWSLKGTAKALGLVKNPQTSSLWATPPAKTTNIAADRESAREVQP